MELRQIAIRQTTRKQAMKYAEDKVPGLSDEARKAFLLIANGLIEKVQRERKIPEIYRFWIETDKGEIIAELTGAGAIRYAFTDKSGVRIYEHEVDKDLIRQTIPELPQH
jgi:hypothetical protein